MRITITIVSQVNWNLLKPLYMQLFCGMYNLSQQKKRPRAFGCAFTDHAPEDGEHATEDGTTKLNAVHVVQQASKREGDVPYVGWER